MTCAWCVEKAEVMILTVSGSIALCRCCSEDWWSIQLQPPSDEFWRLERDSQTVADADCRAGAELFDGIRVAPGDARAVPGGLQRGGDRGASWGDGGLCALVDPPSAATESVAPV